MSIPQHVLVLDAGNSIIKSKSKAQEDAYPHALHPLTEAEYETVLARIGASTPPKDYVVINGQPYVVGESAERHATLTTRTGAARYTRDYYGLLMAATLARHFQEDCEVALFGSHAPGDVAFRDDLMQAAVGVWAVRQGKRTATFTVSYANTFDEPVGGLMNVLLTEDGLHYRRSDVREGRTLVIDIGGHTTDWLAVNPGGEVDYALNDSTKIGILGVMRDFERSFRARYKDFTRSASVLPPERIRQAIASGVFIGGGEEFPCEQEVNEATTVLINKILDTFQNIAGGPAPWDTIILTGGGSAMLYPRLMNLLNHRRVILSDIAEKTHLANVRGGHKLWKLYQAHDML